MYTDAEDARMVAKARNIDTTPIRDKSELEVILDELEITCNDLNKDYEILRDRLRPLIKDMPVAAETPGPSVDKFAPYSPMGARLYHIEIMLSSLHKNLRDLPNELAI